MAKIDKARFWTGVLYPENMREDWKEVIGDTLQYPYAYCQHFQDKDSKSEHRKDHVHLIVAFPNTTTYKHALNVMDLLSAEGKKAINKCEAVVGIRNVYDYLIHDTEDCRKKGKEQYDPSERITGNNFDIGAYEQLGTAEKNEMFLEMGQAQVIPKCLRFWKLALRGGCLTSFYATLRTRSRGALPLLSADSSPLSEGQGGKPPAPPKSPLFVFRLPSHYFVVVVSTK